MLTGYTAASRTANSFPKSDADHGYDFIAMAASSMAVFEPGGDSAWAFFKRELLSAPVLSDNPKWAITPRANPPAAVESPKEAEESAALTADPNPFNPFCRIHVTLTRASDLALQVFDLTGKLISMPAKGRFKAGAHEFVWRGDNGAGMSVASGIYFVRLGAGERVRTLKVVLEK
jgi:hypothetical protein